MTRPLKILIGCEFSGTVREAFRKLGHDATSCDFLPTELPGPHYQGNVLDIVDEPWDIAIFHPTCRYVANSGALRLYKGGKKSNGIDQDRWDKMIEAAHFFKKLYNLKIPHIALENPIMLGYAQKIIGVGPSQTIQPNWFGHPESKATCLWLRSLPNLVPTNKLEKPASGHWENQTKSGQNKLPPSKDRWMIRSRTYPGIADAMAIQWSEYVLEQKCQK